MNKQEFESILGRTVSETNYKMIEYVYTWHPAIDDKDEIAAIYNAGGIAVIKNMQETARLAENLHEEKVELQRKINKLREREELLESGDTTYELCRESVEQTYTLADSIADFSKGLIPLREKFGEETVERAADDLGLSFM